MKKLLTKTAILTAILLAFNNRKYILQLLEKVGILVIFAIGVGTQITILFYQSKLWK